MISPKRFQRLINQLVNPQGLKMQRSGAVALQEGVECLLVEWIRDANRLAIHSGRSTVRPADLLMAGELQKFKQRFPDYPVEFDGDERAYHQAVKDWHLHFENRLRERPYGHAVSEKARRSGRLKQLGGGRRSKVGRTLVSF
jgi:histone H3/H4